jgi:DNA-binding transcriptional LysR family regulator
VNLTKCKLFCDIVRCRSFTEAASLNGITQSAASQAVHQLEQEFEAQLIDRTKRPFMLTAEGEICYEALSEILARYETTRADIKSLRQNISGEVRVAAIYSVGLHDMGATMQHFMARFPKAKVKLEYQLPHKVYEAVLHGTVDLGILSYPRETREISVIPLRLESMALVCHPDHHLAGRRAVMAEQLDGEDFIAFDRELPICKELDRYFRDNRVSVRKVMEFDNVETIKQAVEIGAGLSILPEPTIQNELTNGSLAVVRLVRCDLKRPIGVIHRYRKAFTPVLRRFIEALGERASNERIPQGHTA